MGSMARSAVLVAALAWGALASATALAQQAQPAPEQAAPEQAAPAQEQALRGDPRRGATLSYTCLGCHGIPNYKNAYPNYSVPKLEGQHPEYIAAALMAYRNGERAHTTMHAQASSLSDQDIADISVYLAGRPLQSNAQPVGKPPEMVVKVCVTCHGENGVGTMPQYPTLAGQHYDYIARALIDYKRGGRRNAIMAPFAQQLNDAQIEQVARYFSRQQPSLQIIELRSDQVPGQVASNR